MWIKPILMGLITHGCEKGLTILRLHLWNSVARFTLIFWREHTLSPIWESLWWEKATLGSQHPAYNLSDDSIFRPSTTAPQPTHCASSWALTELVWRRQFWNTSPTVHASSPGRNVFYYLIVLRRICGSKQKKYIVTVSVLHGGEAGRNAPL